MSKIGNSAEVNLPAVIEPTRITDLRLQVLAVNVRVHQRHGRGPVDFRGRIRFPTCERTGERELYRSCDVEGQFSEYAWTQLSAFHQRLSAIEEHASGPVELIVGHATLGLPRASVNQTESGFAAVAILRVFVDDIERARIPGYRWRVYAIDVNQTGTAVARRSASHAMTLH